MPESKRPRLRIALIVFPLLTAGLAVGASTYFKVRQGLAEQRAAVAAGWTAVSDALQERAQLIRELAEAARNSSTAADDILKEIAAAQDDVTHGSTPEQRIRANERLSAAQAKLFLATESTRHAKGNRTFSRLEEQIRDSEERIAVSRRKYNETLEHYNARIQGFPENLVARLAGFSRDDAYFYTEPF